MMKEQERNKITTVYFVLKVEEEERNNTKTKRKRMTNRSINELKIRELTYWVPVFPMKEHSTNEALLPPELTRTVPP